MDRELAKSYVGFHMNIKTNSCYIRGTVIACDDDCLQLKDAEIAYKPAYHETVKTLDSTYNWLLINILHVYDMKPSYENVAKNYTVATSTVSAVEVSNDESF